MDPWGKIGQNRLVKFPAKAESASSGHLTSSSVKDCRTSAKSAVGIRCETRVGVTGGSDTGGDVISAHAFENMSNGDRLRAARKIIIAQGRVPNKSNVRKMARYGIGLNK